MARIALGQPFEWHIAPLEKEEAAWRLFGDREERRPLFRASAETRGLVVSPHNPGVFAARMIQTPAISFLTELKPALLAEEAAEVEAWMKRVPTGVSFHTRRAENGFCFERLWTNEERMPKFHFSAQCVFVFSHCRKL